MKNTQNKGFTLLEIIVVIVILGTLSTMMIPRITGVFEQSRSGEGIQVLTALLDAQRVYEFENEAYTNDIDELNVQFENLQHFNDPTVSTNVNSLATIERGAGATYTLTIAETGSISCTGTDCNKAGCRGGTCN